MNGLKSESRADLVNHCLQLLQECRITVTNLTFDCCPANLTMARILGCKLDFNSDKSAQKHVLTLQTKIKTLNDTFIFPDPLHIIKLIRGTFAEKEILLDSNNEEINFIYVRKLNERKIGYSIVE